MSLLSMSLLCMTEYVIAEYVIAVYVIAVYDWVCHCWVCQWPYKVELVTIHPSRLLNFSLDLQEEPDNSSVSVLKIMASKNVCALEFACILGRKIKWSVIIIMSLLCMTECAINTLCVNNSKLHLLFSKLIIIIKIMHKFDVALICIM